MRKNQARKTVSEPASLPLFTMKGKDMTNPTPTQTFLVSLKGNTVQKPAPKLIASEIRALAEKLWKAKRLGTLTPAEQELWELFPKLLREIEAPTLAAKRAAKRKARPEGLTGAVNKLKNYNM